MLKFRFERPVLSSSQRAQNKHKKNWRAQAKLLDVLSPDIMRINIQETKLKCLAIGDQLFAICRAANTNCYDIGWKIFEI